MRLFRGFDRFWLSRTCDELDARPVPGRVSRPRATSSSNRTKSCRSATTPVNLLTVKAFRAPAGLSPPGADPGLSAVGDGGWRSFGRGARTAAIGSLDCAARSAPDSEGLLHPDALGVAVHDQVVGSMGRSSSAEHELVVVAAGEVAGVLSVRDRLTVIPTLEQCLSCRAATPRRWRRRWGAAAERVALLLLGLGLFWSASRVARRARENRWG